MTENNTLKVNKVESYAIFVNGNFNSIYYHPADGNELFVAITAALKSNPTIVFDDIYIENKNSYSVFVGQDFVSKILLPTYGRAEDSDYLTNTNYAFQHNPTVVWIDSETPAPRNSKYSYDGSTLILIEQ
jgi:hypothetical protein